MFFNMSLKLFFFLIITDKSNDQNYSNEKNENEKKMKMKKKKTFHSSMTSYVHYIVIMIYLMLEKCFLVFKDICNIYN